MRIIRRRAVTRDPAYGYAVEGHDVVRWSLATEAQTGEQELEVVLTLRPDELPSGPHLAYVKKNGDVVAQPAFRG